MPRLTQQQKEDIHDLIIKKLKLGRSLETIQGVIHESVRSRIPDSASNDSDKVRDCLDFLSNLGAVSVDDPLKAFLIRAADTAEEMPEADLLRNLAESLPATPSDRHDDVRSTVPKPQRASKFRARLITANETELRRLQYEVEEALSESPNNAELSELFDQIVAALASCPLPEVHKKGVGRFVRRRVPIGIALLMCLGSLTWLVTRPTPEIELDASTLSEAELIENEALFNKSIQSLLVSKSASELDLVLTGSTFPVTSPMQSPEFSVSTSLDGAQLIVGGVLADGDSRSALTVSPPKLTTQPVVIRVNGQLMKNNRVLLVIGVKLSESCPLHQSPPLARRTRIKKSIQSGNVP